MCARWRTSRRPLNGHYVMQRKQSYIRRLLSGPPVNGPDARPIFRVMAAVLCVMHLVGTMLFARRYLEHGGIGWGVLTLAAIPYGFALGHLSLTGRWVAFRNRRL